jgi:hypothetical protein
MKNTKKCIAEFISWTGEKTKQEVKKEWAQSIADAVAGQFMFIDNVSGFAIRGFDFQHVDIYEVAV